ncbi:hypothetical protein [Pseudomonas moorei]|uniref:hypothetical protein n=1 Tax=Pseudomonas moorei TaxID=395599 RepID=UPI001396714D|nr:hypothetical protein [Pseudomonas moorei]
MSIDYEGPIPFTDTLGKVDINIQPPQLSSEAQEKTKNWSMTRRLQRINQWKTEDLNRLRFFGSHFCLHADDCFWPILLKKSAKVSTTEKYALEIEIFTLSRGFRAQISRSFAQKRRFQQSVRGQSVRTDFFNRIGREPPVATCRNQTGVNAWRWHLWSDFPKTS